MLLKCISLLGLSYLATRQLYRYFWQPLDILLLLKQKARRTHQLKPLRITFSKLNSSLQYSLEPAARDADLVVDRAVAVRYLKELEQVVVYSVRQHGTNSFLTHSQRQLVGTFLPKPFETELATFLTLNKHALEPEVPYNLSYRIGVSQSDASLTLELEKVSSQATPENRVLLFQQIFEQQRRFVIGHRENTSQPLKHSLLVTSQNQPHSDLPFCTGNPEPLFVDRTRMESMLFAKRIVSIDEVFQNSPLSRQFNSIQMCDPQQTMVELQANISQSAQTRNALKRGHEYYSLILIHI